MLVFLFLVLGLGRGKWGGGEGRREVRFVFGVKGSRAFRAGCVLEVWVESERVVSGRRGLRRKGFHFARGRSIVGVEAAIGCGVERLIDVG